MSDEFKLDFQPTPRGFPRAEFRDRQGGKCSIQESSLAGEDCIWLGMDEGTHVDGECLARMHLNREQSGVISCLLAGFAETGEVGRESTRITELEAQLAQAKAAKEIAECAAYQYSTNIAGFELAAKKAEAECNTASARVKELDYALGVALTDCKRFLAEREAAVKAKEAAVRQARQAQYAIKEAYSILADMHTNEPVDSACQFAGARGEQVGCLACLAQIALAEGLHIDTSPHAALKGEE